MEKKHSVKKFSLALSIVALGVAAFPAFAGLMEPLPKEVPGFEDNPAKIELGRKLYHDPRLSADGTVSCNSCHNVLTSGTDNLKTSKGIGHQLGGRNAPTVFNAAFLSVQFWDGRANTLEDQAKGPIINPVEMGMKDHETCMTKLRGVKGYVAEFKKVYGDEKPTIEHVANAIAAYERTLVTPNSKVDRYLSGDKKALNKLELKGMKLVETVGCMTCHMGPNYAGPKLPVGTGFYQKFPRYPNQAIEKKYGFTKDPGRFEVTKKEEDRNLWRVASWRNIARTGPYFHNGAVDSLDEAVRVMAKLQLNKDLKKDEVKAISSFLVALNGDLPKETPPKLPEE